MPNKKASWEFLESQVLQQLPEKLVKLLLRQVRKDVGVARLMGSDLPENCDRRMAVLVLFKDLYRVSFHSAVNDYDLGWKLSQHSFTVDAKRIRRAFRTWAKTQLVLGTAKDWDHAASNLRRIKGLEKINLWMDSTDIQMAHRDGWKRAGPHYSGKMKKWAQRFQVLQDASGRILQAWGGYSPKVYDAHWVDMMKETVEEKLGGGHIVADCHYSTANQYLEDIGGKTGVKFYTPYPKPGGGKRKKGKKTSSNNDDESVGIAKLSKEKLTWNDKISNHRGRVEGPFGVMKQKWKCLDAAFPEDLEQHNCVVDLACAAYNYKLDHPEE